MGKAVKRAVEDGMGGNVVPVLQSLNGSDIEISPELDIAQLLSNAKARSRSMGIEPDLSVEWLEEKVAHGACERTGLPFSEELYLTASKDPFAPSLDRIDSSKGYTQDNVQLVCTIYNIAKATGATQQL